MNLTKYLMITVLFTFFLLQNNKVIAAGGNNNLAKELVIDNLNDIKSFCQSSKWESTNGKPVVMQFDGNRMQELIQKQDLI